MRIWYEGFLKTTFHIWSFDNLFSFHHLNIKVLLFWQLSASGSLNIWAEAAPTKAVTKQEKRIIVKICVRGLGTWDTALVCTAAAAQRCDPCNCPQTTDVRDGILLSTTPSSTDTHRTVIQHLHLQWVSGWHRPHKHQDQLIFIMRRIW